MQKPKPPPPPPPPSPGPMKVKVSKWIYGTLDEVPMDAKYGTVAGKSDKTCHRRQFARALPKGWELAPFKRSILDHPWSTHCLIFKDGKSYGGSAYNKGRGCGNNMLKKDGNRYYARACSRRIVIRKPDMGKNVIKVGKYFYKTLDEVNPKAGYNKDKGLSTKSCHTAPYARSIPQGWELAPLPNSNERKQLFNLPWSTHCLIFRMGSPTVPALTAKAEAVAMACSTRARASTTPGIAVVVSCSARQRRRAERERSAAELRSPLTSHEVLLTEGLSGECCNSSLFV